MIVKTCIYLCPNPICCKILVKKKKLRKAINTQTNISDNFRQFSSAMSLDWSMLGKKQTDLKIRSTFRGQFCEFFQNAERISFFIALQRKHLLFSIAFVYKAILQRFYNKLDFETNKVLLMSTIEFISLTERFSCPLFE